MIHQCHGQTDGQTTCNCKTVLCTIMHHAVQMFRVVVSQGDQQAPCDKCFPARCSLNWAQYAMLGCPVVTTTHHSAHWCECWSHYQSCVSYQLECCRTITGHQYERSEQQWITVELWAHIDAAVSGDVLLRRVVSATVVHRSVSTHRQTRVCHTQWNLQRADPVQQSAAAWPGDTQDETASTDYCIRIHKLCTGIWSKGNDYWCSGCLQRHHCITGPLPISTWVA